MTTASNTRTLAATFGDGYTQRGADGLNGVQKQVPLTWNSLTVAEADTIEDFFIAQGGYIAFAWTAPRDEQPKKWIVTSWNRLSMDQYTDSISATFQQVFDL